MPRLYLLGVLFIGLLVLGGAAMTLHAQQASEPTVKRPEQSYANDPYWQQARVEVYKSVEEIAAQDKAELRHGLDYHKFMHGSPTKKLIALTFDDGPHPRYTPRILAILKAHHARATFFVIGEMAEKAPYLVQAEAAAGDAVGNHTYHHVNLTKILQPDVATEIKACGDVVQRILGQAPHLFRPPGGDYDQTVAEAAMSLNYTTVLWTDDPGDYASPGDTTITKRVLKMIHPGGVILLHDGVQQTIDVLPGLLTYLEHKGYQFVTVDELMRTR
jgi:peptidoglycan/xylan/chitin deacetylase (PgdA/CDA1 family)